MAHPTVVAKTQNQVLLQTGRKAPPLLSLVVLRRGRRSVTATELEMLSCFGVEPSLLDAGVPWCYNKAVYSVEADDLSVSFAVEPGYQDVRLTVRRGDQSLFELNAVGVADLRVIDTPGVDAVEIFITHESWLRLQLRPKFKITQGFRADGRTRRA